MPTWEGDDTLLAEMEGLNRLALRDYDPWGELRSVDAEIGKELRKRLEARQIEPGFEAGTYRDNRHTITFGNAAATTPLSELRHLAERAGLPIRPSNVNLLGTRLADALRLEFEPTAAWYSAFLSTKPSHSNEPIDTHLGRIPVARLSSDTITELQERIEQAIAFWRNRVHKNANLGDNIEALRLYTEALSRLTARDDSETAKKHVRLALNLANDDGLNHWWLNEPIGHLFKRSFDAVPFEERKVLSPELLQFPMAAEREIRGLSRDWYEPAQDAYRFVQRTGNETVFDARVAAFLHQLDSKEVSRPEATIRLLCLYEKKLLTDDQIKSFATALWKDVPADSNALPEGTNLFPHAFLIAPVPEGIDALSRIYSKLFDRGAEVDPMPALAAASDKTPLLQPKEDDAIRLFDDVVRWRPQETDPESVSDAFDGAQQESKNRAMASLLGIVAAPAIAKNKLTIERAKAVLAFLDETALAESLTALPVFYGLNESIDRRIESFFLQPLSAGDRRVTPLAVNALDRWLRLFKNNSAPPLPHALQEHALRALDRGLIGGLSHLIHFARRLIETGCCSDAELNRIEKVLEELYATTAYGLPDSDADVEPDRAVSLPLIRAECVRLALTMERTGRTTEPVKKWRDLAACDPLPEVRNAPQELNDKW